MVRKLTKHGNSLALVIGRPILDLLKIDPETPLDVSTDGRQLIVATELGLELAQRGHEIHFISYAQPIRLRGEEPNIHYHEVEVSRYPLFDYPPYDLALATRMAEVAQLYDLDL